MLKDKSIRGWKGVVLVLVIALTLAIRVGSVEVNHRSLNAPYWHSSDTHGRSATSLRIYFDEFRSREGGDTLAYELSKKSVFGGDWEVVRDDIGTAGHNKSELQILSVRADSTLSSGTFVLGLDREGKTPDDVEALTRTRHIPWDASAATLEEALGDLVNVHVRHVRRCDYFGTDELAHGGDEGWLHGCPYGALGGYRWLIVFDVPMTGQTIPLLKAYRVELGDTWSGQGSQVSSKRIQTGMINPALCHYAVCSYNVTGLREGGLYQFRYRALSSFSGWSEFSKASTALATLDDKLPTRPRPPFLSSATDTSVRVTVPAPPASQAVSRIDIQLRKVGATRWDDEPSVDIGANGAQVPVQLSLLITHLEPGTSYEVRTRFVNHKGPGLYSTASTPVVTKKSPEIGMEALAVVTAVQPHSDALSIELSTTAMGSQSSALEASHTYRLQFKGPSDSAWLTWPEPVTLVTTTAVPDVQMLLTRKSAGYEACMGNFYLSTQDGTVGDLQ